MQIDSVLQQVRPFVQSFGSILITIGALKMFGVNILRAWRLLADRAGRSRAEVLVIP